MIFIGVGDSEPTQKDLKLILKVPPWKIIENRLLLSDFRLILG